MTKRGDKKDETKKEERSKVRRREIGEKKDETNREYRRKIR